LPEALRFASADPPAFIRGDKTVATLACGYRADLVAFDPDEMAVLTTCPAGTSHGANFKQIST